MNVVNIAVEKLHAYKNNPRRNEEAVAAVAASIREFGFKVPLVIDKDNEVVTGHTRLKAAKKLGIKEVPCIIADDLTPEQIRAFRLADNKVGEIAEWDKELLQIELEDIVSIEMDDFGFEMEDAIQEEHGTHAGLGMGQEIRENNPDFRMIFNFNPERAAGKYQMPIIKATNHVPKDLMSFNYMLTKNSYTKGIHFYIDDYQFERIWNQPWNYFERLSRFDCVLTPNFSTYTEMALPHQMWNIYRSKLIGQMMQDYGMTVIPSLVWCREDSFEFAFDGIEPGGTVSVSTIGVKKNEEGKKLWIAGMDEAIRQLKPSHVVVYGGDIGYKFPCEVTYIANHNSERMK